MEKIGQTAWKKAWITNDFIFGNVMQEDDNCLTLLRAILPELNLQKVRLNTQKDIHDRHAQRGVRLDVFAEDNYHRVYNIEMQVRDRPGLGKRIRYYQSKIDIDSLRSGVDYQNIKQSYVIFLCPFDPCGAKLRRYTFRLRCDEQPRITLETGAQVVLLNSKGKYGQVSSNVQSFFQLMNGARTDKDEFTQKLIRDIQHIKADPGKEREFMDMAMKLYDERQIGVQSGIKKGIRKGIQKGIKEGLREGKQKESRENARVIAKKLKNKGMANDEVYAELLDFFEDKLSEKEIAQIVNSIK